nr:phage antirepressor KilAC domain-containing protein [Limosilactobacillus mucosae]
MEKFKNVPSIRIEEKNGMQLVSARELYKKLELKKRFSAWVEQNFKEFEENEDFTSVLLGTEVRNNGGFQHMELQDYEITIDMAKELCMMSHSKYGKVYRKYFIEVERRWNDPQEVIKRGYAYLQNENLQLKIENKSLHNENKLLTADNEEMKPKAIFADAVSASDTPVLVGELAKMLKQNDVNWIVVDGKRHAMGPNNLFKWLRANGYLISRKGTDYNMPTQRSMQLGLFKIKESSHIAGDGSIKIAKTPKVTGKGQIYFVNKFTKTA